MELVPERLKEIRILNGYTLEEVAEKIEVTKQAISKYETGKSLPATNTLIKLLDLYGIRRDYLTNKREIPDDHTIVFYRKCKKTAQKELEMAGVCLKWLYEIILGIDKIYPIKRIDLPNIPVHLSIKDKAELLREVWGIGEDVPGDMVALLESHGFYLFTLDLKEKEIDGYSQMIGSIPIIVLNGAKGTKQRCRFSIAHELGHLVLHQGAKQITDQMEVEADEFAGCFLMPERLVKEELLRTDVQYFIKQAEKWGVSPHALVERCGKLRLLGKDADESEAKRRSLYQNLNRKMKDFAMQEAKAICSVCELLHRIENDPEIARRFIRELHLPIKELQSLCGMMEIFAQYELKSSEVAIDEIGGVQLSFI